MLKMFSTTAILCATLILIFAHAQPYVFQANPSMTPLTQNIPPMMSQQIPPMTPVNQGYFPMQPGPPMPPQQMLQDYQSPIPDNSLQQQMLLLIMSTCSRLTTYIQLLASQMKVPLYTPFNDPMGPNINPTPGPMPYNHQSAVEAQQNYQNQLLLQQHHQQAQFQQQSLDEEQQLQEEGYKLELEKQKQKSEKPNLETENEDLKNQPEKETKITPQDSPKILSTREQKRRSSSSSRTATNNTSDVDQTSYSNGMYIGTEYIPHVYTKPTKYDVFQTSRKNVGIFHNNQDIDQNMEQRSELQQQQKLLQSNNQELNEKPKYEDRHLNQRYINPINIHRMDLKTQIPPTLNSNGLQFDNRLQYQNYLYTKLLEKKQQLKDKQEKELKQPWNNLKDRSKFLQSLYVDHLLHQEYDPDEFEKIKKINVDV